MNRRIARLARAPLLHFVLLGGVLYIGDGIRSSAPEARQPIEIAAADIAHLRADWIRDTAREPSAVELSASLDRHIDDEVLLLEAVRLGLDERDPVVRERLLRNMRFAFPESTSGEAQLLAEARALGMTRRDLVVRRRLIQVMEQRLTVEAVITDGELGDYVARNAQRYARPTRRAFRHIFLSRDARKSLDADARAALERLERDPAVLDGQLGDPFLLGSEFPLTSEAGIARVFGPAFADAVMQGPERRWFGPIPSPYGLHLVEVRASEAESVPKLAELRSRAAYALRDERERQTRQQAIAKLRAQYQVRLPLPLTAYAP